MHPTERKKREKKKRKEKKRKGKVEKEKCDLKTDAREARDQSFYSIKWEKNLIPIILNRRKALKFRLVGNAQTKALVRVVHFTQTVFFPKTSHPPSFFLSPPLFVEVFKKFKGTKSQDLWTRKRSNVRGGKIEEDEKDEKMR